MTQNIYDNDKFFAGYGQLPRSVDGLDGAPEWPALRAMLPDLHGLKVLDLGCGFGWFCHWAREQGAAQVLGIDVSEKMLARARATTQDAAITYSRADMEQLELPPGSFGLVYSSLALHYIANLDRLMAEVYRSLVPGGSLVVSVEHPIFTAPGKPAATPGTGRRSRAGAIARPVRRGGGNDAEIPSVRGSRCGAPGAHDPCSGRPETGRHSQILFDRQPGEHVDPRGSHRLRGAPDDGRVQQPGDVRPAGEAEQHAIDRPRSRRELGMGRGE